MLDSSCLFCAPFGGRRRSMSALSVLVLLTAGLAQGFITGDPPSFSSTTEPQDQFVFERDAGMNPVNLTFLCPVSGSGPPNITWYRDGVVDNVYRTSDGSYVFPNIKQANSTFADDNGVEYYCTATNAFGTIRSPTVRAFYAAFAGFRDGPAVEPGEEPEATVEDVIVAVGNSLQWAALECALKNGSTPTPVIQWVQHDVTSGAETVLTEDFDRNTIRFIDDGQWLILETTADAVTDQEYYCQVTNKERFQMARGPKLYTLNAVTEFDPSVYPNGVKIFKPLTNKTAPRIEFDRNTPIADRVAFGTGIASSGTFTRQWDVNGRGNRVSNDGAVGSVIPSYEGDDESSLLNVTLLVIADSLELFAYLHLLDPAMITESPEDVRDFLVENDKSFTCSVEGSPMPTVTFYHNGVLLQESDQVVIDRGTLTISSAGVEHSGMYQCVVDNESGTAVATWLFLVRAPAVPVITATFTVDPDPCLGYPLIQQDAAPVLLTVTLTADPCPTASWTLNGTAVTTDTADLTITDGCEGYVLGDTEFTFTLSVDEFNETTLGFYAVTFTNPGGSASVPDTRVTDRVRADISAITTEPYSPIAGTNERCLRAGSEVKIVCENVAFPVANVTFFENGIAIDTSTERVTYDSCNTLTITSVEEGDRGSYFCRADNDDTDQAEDSSEIIELEYCIEPDIVGDLTFSKNNPDEGEDTIATCQWTGSPTPEVTWLKDGVPLDERELPSRIRIITLTNNNLLSELQIQDVEEDDTGDYTCNVSNPVGSDRQMKRLEVQETDDPVLSETAIIAIAAGGAGSIVLLTVVVVLLCCVYQCAKRSSGGEYKVPGTSNVPMNAMGLSAESYNVDAPDGPDEEPEAFNPDYASLPTVRPAQPPQYKPTPHYPSEAPPQEDFHKLPPSDEDFVGPYGHDNGVQSGYPPQQPTVDDFVSDDAQFV